jgi:hypothetical protein
MTYLASVREMPARYEAVRDGSRGTLPIGRTYVTTMVSVGREECEERGQVARREPISWVGEDVVH